MVPDCQWRMRKKCVSCSSASAAKRTRGVFFVIWLKKRCLMIIFTVVMEKCVRNVLQTCSWTRGIVHKYWREGTIVIHESKENDDRLTGSWGTPESSPGFTKGALGLIDKQHPTFLHTTCHWGGKLWVFSFLHEKRILCRRAIALILHCPHLACVVDHLLTKRSLIFLREPSDHKASQKPHHVIHVYLLRSSRMAIHASCSGTVAFEPANWPFLPSGPSFFGFFSDPAILFYAMPGLDFLAREPQHEY